MGSNVTASVSVAPAATAPATHVTGSQASLVPSHRKFFETIQSAFRGTISSINELDNSLAQWFDNDDKKIQDLEAQLQASHLETAKSQQELDILRVETEKEKTRMQQMTKASEEEKATLREKAERFKQGAAALRRDDETRRAAQVSALQTELARARAEVTDFRRKTSELQSEVDVLRAQVESVESDRTRLLSENAWLRLGGDPATIVAPNTMAEGSTTRASQGES